MILYNDTRESADLLSIKKLTILGNMAAHFRKGLLPLQPLSWFSAGEGGRVVGGGRGSFCGPLCILKVKGNLLPPFSPYPGGPISRRHFEINIQHYFTLKSLTRVNFSTMRPFIRGTINERLSSLRFPFIDDA
jgi:hypothetical protein